MPCTITTGPDDVPCLLFFQAIRKPQRKTNCALSTVLKLYPRASFTVLIWGGEEGTWDPHGCKDFFLFLPGNLPQRRVQQAASGSNQKVGILNLIATYTASSAGVTLGWGWSWEDGCGLKGFRMPTEPCFSPSNGSLYAGLGWHQQGLVLT